MDFETEGAVGLRWPRERTLSNMSQQSSHSLKMNFPLMTCDSGLYTCSSMTSDSDTDSCHVKERALKDDDLQSALRDARRLRSELERLTKSEQWYKQELRHQKSTRLEDLERIYTQERKFIQDNQRLQKECVRLYEKCTEFERELQKQQQESSTVVKKDTHVHEEDNAQFEVQQQSAVINDQQQLIIVLRKQKKALLNDLRNLTEEKDEKVMEMQRLLADLEFDNKRITKKCTDLSKERSQMDSRISLALDEKLNLQKSLVDLREQLELQKLELKLKEDEIAQLQIDFKDKMRNEHDLDEVHRLSLKYHDEVNSKSLEIITLKSCLSNMHDELESLQELQTQNDRQQRLIEQLNFSLEACKLELQEIKESELLKSSQIQDLQQKTDQLLQDNADKHKQLLNQQHDLANVCQELKVTNEQYTLVQERYKETQFRLELLEIEQSKLKFQSENDQQEIQQLRQKLREYLHQTSELGEKMHRLEAELKKTVEENVLLRSEFEKLQQDMKVPTPEFSYESNRYSKDFLELSEECKRLQSTLDAHGSLIAEDKCNIKQHLHSLEQPTKADIINDSLSLLGNQENEDLSVQFNKLLENANLLEYYLKEKENIINAVNSAQHSNEGLQKLVAENEILRTKLYQIENEANSLQLKQDINDMTKKCTVLETLLDKQEHKVKNLQLLLLDNDSKLYKMERQLKILQDAETPGGELQVENLLLKDKLATERLQKTDLNAQLTRAKDRVETMQETLEQYESKQQPTSNKSVQCDIEKQEDICQEVKYLKEQILNLQEKQDQYVEVESNKSDERERVKIWHNLLFDLQNSKIKCLKDSQSDWEDMLKSLNTVQSMEEQTRRELELKRMELEELNQVFAEQNEELRKMEELAALIEFKRQNEKEQLKQTFQYEITVMKQQLMECRQEIEQQQEMNHQLQQKNERIQHSYNDDYATEIADYRREVRSLKNKVGSTLSEKDDMLERIRDLENELKEIKHQRRAAVILPEATNETSITEINSNLSDLKSNVGEDHLRILTKVLEGEYARKMQRYDEHIHSLLANVNGLKKSLKYNEEKTAILSEEQGRTLDELKDLQKTKRNLEDLRSKYEQSQNTVKELKKAFSLEKKKFESSDLGKSQNEISTYEVANLIDDYKKLIQQSAFVTKRPATSSILDLIQRSNQCVPNFQKLEVNIGDLRCDLQNLLSSYTQKMPVTSLITAASLTVPPSLMDELRVASDGF